MDLQNRENFLNKLAAKMGKARAIVPEPMDAPVNTYPTERLTHLSAVDLANEFTNSAKTMMVDVNVCKESDAVQTLLALCEKYGGGDVVLNSDERLTALGDFLRRLKRNIRCHTWSSETAQNNIRFSEKANLGVVYAEYGLAETGGIVLFSSADRGRSVSLLPEKSICCFT